jgi:hypothetical protein
MAGVAGRSGRRRNSTKRVQCTFDDIADLTFQQAGILIKDTSIPLIDRVRVCLPVALKRIPDRTINTTTSYNISEETAKAMLAEAQRNLLIYKRLDEEDKQAGGQAGQVESGGKVDGVE